MYMRSLGFVAPLFLLSITVLPVVAQVNSGRLDGIVQDQSGAVVPNAKVVALNVKTQKETQATSDAQGNYVVTALQPGTYRLTVDAPGFRKAVINAIELNVDSIVSQIVKLEVGQTTETVMVEANAVSVQTTDAQNGQVINLKDIDTLPVLGRTAHTHRADLLPAWRADHAERQQRRVRLQLLPYQRHAAGEQQ